MRRMPGGGTELPAGGLAEGLAAWRHRRNQQLNAALASNYVTPRHRGINKQYYETAAKYLCRNGAACRRLPRR